MIDEAFFEPANAPNLREVVYEKIKDAITSGVIPAGMKLSELDLSKQFDVSRTPVREAIRQLASTGLVKLVPRRGAYVLLPTKKDVADLYEIRGALESLSLEHLCRRPPEEHLREERDYFTSLGADSKVSEFVKRDIEFHGSIARSADNSYLELMLSRVSSLLTLCRHYALERVDIVKSSLEHVAIIDAVLAHDADNARRLMKLHMDNTRDGLLDYISQHPEATEPTD